MRILCLYFILLFSDLDLLFYLLLFLLIKNNILINYYKPLFWILVNEGTTFSYLSSVCHSLKTEPPKP